MTIDELATEIERLYWADADVRCASGDGPSEAERIAVNTHLRTMAEYTARAAARWAKRIKRPMRVQPQFVAERVAQDSRDLMENEKSDKVCGIVLSTVGWLLLRSLLENLAWRFALWLFSDSTSEDRGDLICRMEGA
ncbi:MAG: hypothetical protein ACK6D3_11130 [Planctomycetaceae bacterium]|jgi:hypothetical protein